MNTISLKISCSIIIRICLSIWPHCPGSFSQLKLSLPFSEPKNSLTWQSNIHLDIFMCYEKCLIVSWNQCIKWSSCAAVIKIKWTRTVFKIVHIQSHCPLSFALRYNVWRNWPWLTRALILNVNKRYFVVSLAKVKWNILW
jgi:hypothetical protein